MFLPAILFCVVQGILSSPSGFAPDEKPKFPESFTTNVEGLFIDENTETSATIYYDRKNNRAAIDILYQSESTREIFLYDDSQVITIQGTSCSIDPINNQNAFFPYTDDNEMKKKTLATAEESFYFTKSEFYPEDTNDGLPTITYKGIVDVQRYQKENCDVTHRFSKPEVTTAQCDLSPCEPTIMSITVECGKGEDKVLHKYFFYNFRSSVTDESVFQVPTGIYCPLEGGPIFPEMPTFFCMDYDNSVEWIANNNVQDKQDFYKTLCFDAEYKLVHVRNYNAQGLVSTQIYDFLNYIGMAITPNMQQCEVGPITDELTLASATFLPDEIFPMNSSAKATPSYVGQRSFHGLSYLSWSSHAENPEMEIVRDFYFTLDSKFSTMLPVMRLSHIQEYFYEKDSENTEKKTLSKVSYTPVRKVRTNPRDWSVFDVSMCYPKEGQDDFLIHLQVSCLLESKSTKFPEVKTLMNETSFRTEVTQQVHYQLVQASNISLIRISQLQVYSSRDERLVFKGKILEHPSGLTYTIYNGKNESSMETAFQDLKETVGSGNVHFDIQRNATTFHFQATYFSTPETTSPFSVTDESLTYTKGAMAGLGIVMALIGGVVGAVVLFVYFKSRRRTEH